MFSLASSTDTPLRRCSRSKTGGRLAHTGIGTSDGEAHAARENTSNREIKRARRRDINLASTKRAAREEQARLRTQEQFPLRTVSTSAGAFHREMKPEGATALLVRANLAHTAQTKARRRTATKLRLRILRVALEVSSPARCFQTPPAQLYAPNRLPTIDAGLLSPFLPIAA